jgi:hypothetical protein
VIENTTFYEKLVGGHLQLPPSRKPQNDTRDLLYVFTLSEDFLKLFSQKDLNPERKIVYYRLSRSRRIVENVFGIMAPRFRIFHTQIILSFDSTETIVMTCCVLHRRLHLRCTSFEQEGSNMEEFEGDQNVFIPFRKEFSRHCGHQGRRAKEMYLQCFSHEGKVKWQNKAISWC